MVGPVPPPAGATICGRTSKTCRARWATPVAAVTTTMPPAWPRSRGPSVKRNTPPRPRPKRPPPTCASVCCGSPTCPRPTRPTVRGRRTTRSCAAGRRKPALYAEHQRVPHWDIGARAGHLGPRARAPSCRGRCSPSTGGWGHASSGRLTAFALDRHRDAFEEVRPPTSGAHRDHGVHRPPAQVLRRGLPRRARRPVGHPHRRGAPHVHAPWRRPRRVRPPHAAHGRERLLPTRGGRGGT